MSRADRIFRAVLWALLLAALVLDDHERRAEGAPVPCGTDQDCAELNPGARGLYAFPEKGGNR